MNEHNESERSPAWTEITLTMGGAVIPAVLNNCRSATELIARLPCAISLHRYDHDYCGVLSEPLSYDAEDLRCGWSNGDIAFAAEGSYFAILYKDEEISEQFGNLVTLGKIKVPPSVMGTLDRQVEVRIEKAGNS